MNKPHGTPALMVLPFFGGWGGGCLETLYVLVLSVCGPWEGEHGHGVCSWWIHLSFFFFSI